jgi:AraC family transcriptional regulator
LPRVRHARTLAAMTGTQVLAAGGRLAAGMFFGGARLTRSGNGIAVSHRIAEGAPESVTTHTHEDAHFILVTGGDYVSIAEGHRRAGQATLIYNPPGTRHRDHFAGGRGSFFAISVAPGLASKALAEVRSPTAPRYLAGALQHSLALALANSCAREPSGLSLEALSLELIGSLDEGSAGESAAPPLWLLRAREVLEDCYAEDLSVAAIAAAVGVHPVHLARRFRAHYRCTPGAFARYRRLQRAAGLLVRSRQSLAEIAVGCGFADQSHLTRSFTRCFGMPPAEYRHLTAPPRGLDRLQIDKTQR